MISFEISLLQHANDLMAASSQRGGTTFNFKNEQGKIQRELQAAKKDNDFIYHDKVPDVKTLDTIGKATIAKPSPLPSSIFSDKFQGMFFFILLVSSRIIYYFNCLDEPCGLLTNTFRDKYQGMIKKKILLIC